MSDIAHPPTLWSTFSEVLTSLRRTHSDGQDLNQENKATRTLICDLMETSPDGFGCELDVQNMLHMFPGRY